MKRRDFERLKLFVVPWCICVAALGSAIACTSYYRAYPTTAIFFHALLAVIPIAAVIAILVYRMSRVWGFIAAWYSLVFQTLVTHLSSRPGIAGEAVAMDIIWMFVATLLSYMFYVGSKSIPADQDEPVPHEVTSES